ncbi:hypothetical protein Tco_1011816 [Tanacetum coccineum]
MATTSSTRAQIGKDSFQEFQAPEVLEQVGALVVVVLVNFLLTSWFSFTDEVMLRGVIGDKDRVIYLRNDDFGVELGLKVLEEDVVPKVDDVSLVDGVFDGAFGGDGEEDFIIGGGVVVSSSSLDMFTKSCIGEMIVSLIFLEGLEEEDWVESIEVEEK